MPGADKPLSSIDFEAAYRHFTDVAGVGLAVSGGADSLCLLFSFAHWRTQNAPDLPVCVLTVDHGLRAEAAEEARFVAGLCDKLALDHYILPVQSGAISGNLQAGAREARYDLMTSFLSERGYGHLLVAHHRDDQAETFLIRLARGSGLKGLAAMTSSRMMNGISVERPFLSFSRYQTESYLNEVGQSWIDDPSNHDDRFARVRIRKMLPQLAELGLDSGRISETLERLRRSNDALQSVLLEKLRPCLKRYPGLCFRVDRGFFDNQHPEFNYLAVRLLVGLSGNRAYPPRADALESHIAEFLQALSTGEPYRRTLGGAVLEFWGNGLWIYREDGREGLPAQELADKDKEIIWDQRYRVNVSDGFRAGDVICPLSILSSSDCPSLPTRYLEMPPAARMAVPILMREGVVSVLGEAGLEPEEKAETGNGGHRQGNPVLVPLADDEFLTIWSTEYP
ncbi:tRNA lysidine(34) synthetase TilS [Coralliovum pocilloporae]|uniref:tRNA lysidine(34) synthetase TilS n=1 Tax=Coralliovum pocilloporae TaxID=3066369 RepID=UPI0033071374